MILDAMTAIPRGIATITTHYTETVLIFVALAGAVAFVVAYPWRVPPRHWTREGWHMWTFTLALCSLGGSSVTRRIWPEVVETLAYVAAIQVTYAALAVLVWQRVWLLFTADRRDKILHEKRDTP